MNTIKNPVNDLLKYFTITLFITALGLIIGNQLPYTVIAMFDTVFMVLILISFLIAIFCRRPKNGHSRREFPMAFTYGYGLFFGITITPAMKYYVSDLGAEVVIAVFIGTLLIVGMLSMFSFTKGNDSILKIGPILFITTIGLCLTYFILLFFTNLTTLSLVITIVSILTFSLWVIYDVYRFKKNAMYITSKRELAPYVLDIYIDFINLFLDLLRLVSRFSSDN